MQSTKSFLEINIWGKMVIRKNVQTVLYGLIKTNGEEAVPLELNRCYRSLDQ